MNNFDMSVAASLVMLGGYGLILFVGRLLKSRGQLWFVWCSRVKCFSLVDTGSVPPGEEKSPAVQHCLLWPELHSCDQRCIK
jgi:hypothetical protein